jgi:ligand-binding sensor domain-containing protein/two-component sensor histidine kinase
MLWIQPDPKQFTLVRSLARNRRRYRFARFQLRAAVGLFLILATTPTRACALAPNQPATSYLRTTFTVEDGLSSNVVNAILQTRDGFLWVATDAGLNRFDGRHFTTFYFRGPKSTPQGIVRSLAEGVGGDLWIGTNTGLVRISRPGLDQFDGTPPVFYHTGTGKSDEINFLHVTNDGTLWVGTSAGLYRFVGNQFQVVVPNAFVSRMEESVDGHLLFISNGHTFVELDGTRVIEHPNLPHLPHELSIDPDLLLTHALQDHNGSLWFATPAGVLRYVNGSIERFRLYGKNDALQVYEDPQGNLWVLGQTGIFRISGTKLEPLAPNIPSRIVSADRAGNLWVGTNGEGLIRFKNRSVRILSKADGLPNNIPMTVLSKRDGTLWVGNNCGGVSVFDGEHFKTYDEKDGLSNSCVWALAEGKSGELWIGTWGGGLYRFKRSRFVQFTMREGLAGKVVRAITVAHDGSLWIATEGGLSHMVKGQFHNYTTADGLSSNPVVSVHQDRHGTIWVGTSRGINRMTGDRFAPVFSPHEIFDPRYTSLAEDSSGQLYALSAPKGIDRIEGNQLVAVNHDLDLLSMVTSSSGEFWFTGANGIFRFSSAAFGQNQADPERPPDYAWFDKADGMVSTQCSVGTPNMALAADGKLWIATVQGLAMLDLQHLPFDTANSRVFIEDVTVGRTRQPAGRELPLPPGTHHVELHFDSISLASAEKIRFQYRLDDVDPVWLDADNSLTAVYTNIPIGTHAFRIRASNSDGVWDRSGISFAVIQKPYFYQTWWFLAVCIGAFLGLLSAFYHLRVRRLHQRFAMVVEARVDERTRIARELHDTLLQSLHGLLFRFQAARNMLPRRPEEATEALDGAIARTEQAIGESQDAITGLRPAAQSDLEDLLRAVGNDLENRASDRGAQPTFEVIVEGERRAISPTLQAEVCRIASEILRNSFRHACARRIEAEIRYGDEQLRVRIRDDGKGIDPEVLLKGSRQGHWGLPGVKERAKQIGAQLVFWSEAGAGTEVQLSIPAAIAYKDSPDRPKFKFFRRVRVDEH